MANSPLFQLLEKILYFCGIWKLKSSTYFKVFSILIQIPIWINFLDHLFYLKYALLVIIKLNRQRFITYIGTFFSVMNVALKVRLFQTKQFQKFFSHMFNEEERINESTHDEVRDVHLKNTNNLMSLVQICIFSMIATVTGLTTSSVILIYLDNKNPKCTQVEDKSCLKMLSLEFAMPVNVNDHYIVANIYVDVIIGITGYVAVAVDLSVLASVVYIASKLRRLQCVLRNMKELVGNEQTKKLLHQKQYDFVKQCIVEHQLIIKELEELNGMLRYFILFDFFVHSLQVAAFLSAVISSTETVFYRMFILNCACYMLFQLFLMYWPAHILKDESVNISTAIYESNWYETDVRTRRNLVMMMMRAQRPLKLTIGPMYDVDLLVFLKLLKTIYTFITLFTNRKLRT